MFASHSSSGGTSASCSNWAGVRLCFLSEQWAFRRETFFQRFGLPSDPNEVASYLKARLNRAYDLFLQTAPGNSYASVDEDGWCLSVDTLEKPRKEADEKLLAVFDGKKVVSMFEMTKLVNGHLV